MNNAFLARRAWRLHSEPAQLWAQVLQAKYINCRNRTSAFEARNGDSNLWRNLCKIWAEMEGHLSWSLGKGNEIRFWKDRWLDGLGRMEDYLIQHDQDLNLNTKVKDWLTPSGDWNLARLKSYLPENVILRLQSLLPPAVEDQEDKRSWDFASTAQPSVGDIYHCLAGRRQVTEEEGIGWNRLWAWKGPQKPKVFMWKALHARLPTRARVAKWNNSDPLCPRCRIEEESIIHMLRDCVWVRCFWVRLKPELHGTSFFVNNLQRWIIDNLREDSSSHEPVSWASIFIITCWKLWSWRNLVQHGGVIPPVEVMEKTVKNLAEEVVRAQDSVVCRRSGVGHAVTTLCWQFPHDGCVKLNSDGAARGNPGLAACGGVLRDASGKWMAGFARRLGVCSSYRAELWGILRGLEITWSEGFRNIIVESDSSSAITVLTSTSAAVRESNLISRIRTWLNKDWNVRVQHTYREGNRCADWLANFLLDDRDQPEEITLKDPPGGILPLYQADLAAVGWSRRIAYYC